MEGFGDAAELGFGGGSGGAAGFDVGEVGFADGGFVHERVEGEAEGLALLAEQGAEGFEGGGALEGGSPGRLGGRGCWGDFGMGFGQGVLLAGPCKFG